MIPTEHALENYNLTITQEIHVNASLEITFEALLEELQDAQSPSGPIPMKLEAWPGGRWYRDLGNNLSLIHISHHLRETLRNMGARP